MPAPTRNLVQKLAVDIQEGRVDAAAEVARAWSGDDAESVATYALASAVAEKPLPAQEVLSAVVLLDDQPIAALLVEHVTGDRIEALLDAVEHDGAGDVRDALALYLAAKLHSKRERPKKSAGERLLTLVRTHARRSRTPACGELFVAAGALLGDDAVRAVVAASFPDMGVRHAEQAVTSLLAGTEGAILDVLPDHAPPSLSAGVPIRSGERPGRNDPCWCGSGKKYKKCHQDKDLASVSADPEAAWRKQLEGAAATMTAQQVVDLRLADIQTLPYASLRPEARVAAYRELLRHRRWEAADRVLEAMSAVGEAADKHRVELVDEAFRSRALDVARAHAERLPDDLRADSLIAAMQAVSSPGKATLSKLEDIAERGVGDSPVVLLDVADALLSYYPALGIVAARGALATAHPNDATVFLDLVEEARDKLALPPGDPAEDVHRALARFDKELDAEASARKTAEQLAVEVGKLRQSAQESATRIHDLEARLKAAEREPESPPSPPPGSWEAERGELRERITELKALVAEGNAERVQLRRRLAEAEERAAGEASAPASSVQEVIAEDDSTEGVPQEALRVRGTMIPHFERAAEASLIDMPSRVVRDALRVVSDLCSGEGNVWREIKQLERISPPMYSARVGIHYRLLFRMEPGVLQVYEVVAREGLLAAVRRLWR
jgi:hypothetical protein